IGISNVSLRDLGPQRALVLVDGTRLIPSVGTVPDTNTIPLTMVERVDVLRDGASSVYGADAIGGVVNIITKRKADGFHLEAGGGLTQHGGGQQYNIGGTWGASNDRGSVLVGASWEHRNAINGYQRDWANDPHIGEQFEGGSTFRTQLDALQNQGAVTLAVPTVVDGVLAPAGTTYPGAGLVVVNGVYYTRQNPALAGVLPNTVFLPNKGVVKLNANGSKETPWNTLQGSIDRKSFNYSIDYDLTDGITLFSDGFYTKRTSRQLLRPEPLLGDQIANGTYPGFIIPAGFPGNRTTGDFGANLIPIQFGPRDYRQNSDTFRVRVGFKGEIFGDLRYEIAGVEQQNDLQAKVLNTGNFLSLGQLTGQLPCISVPGGCTGGLPTVYPGFFTAAPDQIFNAAQLDYAKYTQISTNESSERYVYGNINGSLFQLPGGAAKFAVGAEYRGEHYTFVPDALVVAGFAPNQSFPTDGGYNVKSAYGELFLPILSDLPGAYRLEITPSGRIDSYSNFGTAKTWKIGANYAPVEDIRFRGSYSIGFRAPQVAELFGGTFLTNLTAGGDPCETFANPPGIVNPNVGQGILAAGSTCAVALNGGAAMLPNTFHDPLDDISQQQIQVLAGGNPNLQPEKSKGYTAGVVFQPTFMRGFTFSFDYYRTKVRNQILPGGLAGSVGADFIL
ncbi:TonB-dependent receptor domain-containing protein, partial [Sphingomonas sp.]|uniref:TonB-dependent receptor plug domain-containing protein n=1 Tax=Sphingomonas sp. TaxID=28214 RepID=UPI00286CA698